MGMKNNSITTAGFKKTSPENSMVRTLNPNKPAAFVFSTMQWLVSFAFVDVPPAQLSQYYILQTPVVPNFRTD